MDKRATFELSAEMIVKIVLALFMILIMLSLFFRFLPCLSNVPIGNKLLVLMSLFVIYDNITWILAKMLVTW